MTIAATGAKPRAVAALALDAVLSRGNNLQDALAAAGLNELQPRDRSFATALAFGAVRTHLRNQYLVSLLADRPFRRRDSVILALLSVGLYALTESRRPDYATVSATVDAAAELGRRQMKGVVNALLRRFLRERDTLLARVNDDEEARWQHPAWLLERFRADWPAEWQEIVAAGNLQPPMWVRVNLQKTDRQSWLSRLDAPVARAPTRLPAAVMLSNPLPVETLPGFPDGHCSVQDGASQFAALLLNPQPGMRVLDACAAPGGKTTHLLEIEPQVSELVALDISRERLARIAENLTRLGLQANLVAGDALAPAKWWDGRPFDRILLDAPCSATGVIRRHPDIRFLRAEADISKLAGQQLQLLRTMWPLLQYGGRLLYSTCSIIKEENQQVIQHFLAEQDDAREVFIGAEHFDCALPDASPGRQLLAGRADCDGFYYALIEKLPD
jgi:16S rRNA (cytosine967-C5)-methyltransferase